MKVRKLIELLQDMPQNADACLVFDSAVCCEDIKAVRLLKPDEWGLPRKHAVVGLLDDGSADEYDDEGKRK